MTEKKKTYRGATLALVVASLAICTLVCGCTTTSSTTTDEVATTITGEISESTAPPDGTQRSPPANGTAGGGFDLASAAAELGVTEDALEAALGGGTDGKQMDLEAAAEELGVTVEELQAALGGQMGGPSGGEMPTGRQMPQDGRTPPNGTPPATPS